MCCCGALAKTDFNKFKHYTNSQLPQNNLCTCTVTFYRELSELKGSGLYSKAFVFPVYRHALTKKADTGGQEDPAHEYIISSL